jgi:tetratricopeptide (TPR) repeat protein
MDKVFGLDSALKIGEDVYHIESYAKPKHFKVISQTYKSGKILNVNEKEYDQQITEKDMLRLIQTTHNHQIKELCYLLQIAENVQEQLRANAFNKIGILFLKKGFYKEAKKSFESAIKADDSLTDAHRNLGTVYKKLGDPDRAIAQLTRALYLAPNNADYYLDLALAYLEKDMYEEAFTELKKAINLNEDYADAYFNLGLLILKEKVVKRKKAAQYEINSAKLYFKNASILDERYQDKTYRAAFNQLWKDNYVDALKLFEQFLVDMRRIDVHEFIADFELFSKLSGLKDTPITVEEYVDLMNSKIEKYPRYPDLRNALGKAYLIKVRALFNAARQQFKKALEINPDYHEARKNLELLENEMKGFILFLRAILK